MRLKVRKIKKGGFKVNLDLEFEAPTWHQIYKMLVNLAQKIRDKNFALDIIVGVSRGGWIPARILSDLLCNPNLANIRSDYYLGVSKRKAEPTLTQPVSMTVKDKRILVVDEVADTGQSLQIVKQHILDQGAKEVQIAALYYKPWCTCPLDYYARETTRWIVFPWEIKETIQSIVTKCRENNHPIDGEIEKLVQVGISLKLVTKFCSEIFEEKNC
jgi:hypoxanthine phosphoribosyltransferase